MESTKRKWLAELVLLSLVAGCNAVRPSQKERTLSEGQVRFKDIGLVLVTDAVRGSEMLGVEFFADGWERPFYAASVLSRKTREIMSSPGGRVPEKVRVVWRKKDESFWQEGLIRYDGEIAGEYTIDVASRIPDEVIKELRSKGGALRLKFRLKPDGVMFGWDIERAPDEMQNYSREEIMKRNLYFPSVYPMVGGDFVETRY